MNVCIVFHLKYYKPEASVSQTIGLDAERPLSIYGYSGATKRAKQASAPPATSLEEFNPKRQAFKCVFELTGKGSMGWAIKFFY